MPRPLLLLMIIVPLVVAALLLAGAGVAAVYAFYQVGVCLVLPVAVDLGRRRWSWRRHLAHLGLTGPGTGRGVALGLGLGVIAGGAILAFFAVGGERFLTGDQVARALAAWGIAPGELTGLVPFMAAVSGPAEELFWRGFCAAELAGRTGRAVRLLVPSLLYASYHAATVPPLLRSPALVVLALAAVAGAGLAWAWLRERTGSVWPALLSHAAAAGAYMVVARQLLAR